jgi:GNAT superfamily N-acetyltransferase
MAAYTDSGLGYVARVHGHPACFVFEAEGHLRYVDTDLSLSAITGVATDRTGRKQGLAKQLTAKAVAEAGARGLALAGLSTFEQGFYDQLGFGTGAYEYIWRFDPNRLLVEDKVRPPHHLTADHIDAIHAARLARRKHHGNVSLYSVGQTRSTVLRSVNGFGLGYFDDGTETPSHCLWCSATATAEGPYTIEFMAWQTPAQFLELLGLVKQWGDQVRLVMMAEPSGIQLQDFIDRPTQHFQSTQGGQFATGCRAHAYFQYRILDLAACIAAVPAPSLPCAFHLDLHDPISDRPADRVGRYSDPPWTGLSGSYTVRLDGSSTVTARTTDGLPTLTAGVGAFTRMWLGVRPASGLAVTDRLAGPPELLARLDDIFRRPNPLTDWQY